MEFTLPIIKQFSYCTKVKNDKGYTLIKENRESAALIFTLRGKISFTSKYGEVISDKNTPVYIPQGATYKNSCLESADSIMFCFFCDEPNEKITPLSAFDKKEVSAVYERICNACVFDTPSDSATVMALLYTLIGKLVNTKRESSILSPALKIISTRFDSPSLSLDLLAKECNISKPYLHKLFLKEFSLSPYQYLLKFRMKKATELLCEDLSVGKVAESVGYSDIYQFSRAFKKVFGISPEGYKKGDEF